MICAMKPIQLTFDEELLQAIDRQLKRRPRSRSEFVRECVRKELARLRIKELEEIDRRGYERKPIRKGEFEWLLHSADLGAE